MNDAPGLRIATVLGLFAVTLALVMNTCAMDRLEKQVIATRQAVDAKAPAPMAVAQPVAVSKSGVPGAPTGFTAVGWGGRQAEILHVEGAQPGAPLTLDQKPKPQGDHYVKRRPSPPQAINQYITNEYGAKDVSQYSYDRMILLDVYEPPNVVPGLALRWEVSDDKLTYTYHLRRGVLHADGRPFTSADVQFTFDVVRDPEVNAAHIRAGLEKVVSLQTPDNHTVVVRYSEKDWTGLYAVGYHLPVLNRAWYEDTIPKAAERLGIDDFSATPGTPGFAAVFNKIRIPSPGPGPYYYEGDRYEPTEGVELVQNPFYWGMQVYPGWYNFSKLRWIFITDEVAAFEEFRKGTFDTSVVDHDAWQDEYQHDPTIQETANYYVYDHTGLFASAISWNARQPPFDDPRVRRAMTHLIDRQWIVDEVERGQARVAVCNSKPSYPSYSLDLEPLSYDLDEAKRLLAEAGWVDSDGDGVLDRDGKRFEFELKMGSPRRFYFQVSGLLGDACKQVGIRMTPRTLEWATFIEDFYERRFDAALLYQSFSGAWVDPYEGYHSSQDVPRGGNASGWRHPRADELLEAMRGEFDEAKRNELFHEFNRLFQQEQPKTLLVHGLVGVLQNKRFEDVKVLPTGLRFNDYWVKPENVKYR